MKPRPQGTMHIPSQLCSAQHSTPQLLPQPHLLHEPGFFTATPKTYAFFTLGLEPYNPTSWAGEMRLEGYNT